MVLSHRNVSAVIVTRGDKDLTPILSTLPFKDIVVWDNSVRPNKLVYGRYLAAALARNDIIYTQDDDCIVDVETLLAAYEPGIITNLMDIDRSEYYQGRVTLIGWGAIFQKSLVTVLDCYISQFGEDDLLLKECDRIFTGLNDHRAIEVKVQNLDYAMEDDRMFKQANHWDLLAKAVDRVAFLRGELSESIHPEMNKNSGS